MVLIESSATQLPKLRFLDKFMEGHPGYIAGGCFKGLFSGEKIKDIDIFFSNKVDFELGVNHFKTENDFFLSFQSERVIRFTHAKSGLIAELISGHLAEPEEMISNFDFTITKAFYTKSLDGTYVFKCHERFFEHLMNKKLVIDDKILYPLSTFNRSFRYTRYGYGLCGESKEKVIQSLQGAVVSGLNDFYFGID